MLIRCRFYIGLIFKLLFIKLFVYWFKRDNVKKKLDTLGTAIFLYSIVGSKDVTIAGKTPENLLVHSVLQQMIKSVFKLKYLQVNSLKKEIGQMLVGLA